MKKLSAILVMVLIFAMTVVAVHASDVAVTLSTDASTVDVGATIAVKVNYSPASTMVASLQGKVTYDPSLVTFVSCTPGAGITGFPNDNGTGTVNFSYASGSAWGNDPLIFTFKGIEGKSGVAKFNMNIEMIDDEECNGELENPTVEELAVTIGSEPVVPPTPAVFTVTAVDNGANTVVTVANKGDLEGLVYAASYDSNNVLVNCAPAQALANGELTFSGITGNVKVFVWDANNAPLLDAFVTATVQ